jgi:hypothetical protein
MIYPDYGNLPRLPWRDGMLPTQIAVSCAQLLTNESLDRFQKECNSSPFDPRVKEFINREFYPGCDISKSVKYMMNYHIDEIRTVGFTFDWVLRNKKFRQERMGR